MTPLLKQLSALASEKRLCLLGVLTNANELLSTSALAALCDMTVSLASRHLRTLEEAGLTTSASSGPYTLHALKRDSVKSFILDLSDLLRKDAPDVISPIDRSEALPEGDESHQLEEQREG